MLPFPSRTVPSLFLALSCCPEERDRELNRGSVEETPRSQDFPEEAWRKSLDGEAIGPVCNHHVLGLGKSNSSLSWHDLPRWPFPATINHMTAFVHRSSLRGGWGGLCTVSAAFNLMNGAQATCFEALFCSQLRVFPVGFVHSLLVFHKKLQKTSPEKRKLAT